MPTNPQLALLLLAVALFTAGGLSSFARLWYPNRTTRLISKSCLYWGIAACIAVLAWHSHTRHRWMPIGDNFDALIWLAVLLAGFVAYTQGTRPLPALDWFIMPPAVFLLICAAIFGRADFHPYVGHAWSTLHRITSFSGAAFFAVAAAAGAMYVVASAKLRRKQPTGPYLGSLERLEHLTMTAVTLGFALLSIGIVTGVIELMQTGRSTPTPKIFLAFAVWIIYALVLHAPINPVFRGRRAALLSVLGFVLMIGAILTAEVSR